jgi:diguanylate cyclase
MMNKNCRLIAAVLTVMFGVSNFTAVADEIIGPQQVFNNLDALLSKEKKSKSILAIDDEILSLKILSEQDKAAAQVKLLALQDSSKALNFAEQYLLHVIRANIANIDGQEHKVINWLNKAIKLETFLAKKQLDTPLFSNVYLTLAKVYEKQGEDQKAFDSKKQYVKKYFSHLKQQKLERVERLSEKYNIEKSQEENELLTQNNQIKYFALASAEAERAQQQRNIVIFIVVTVVFFLLLLRQFKIRRALKTLARTDNLTTLANRRSFFNNGYTYMAQALMTDKELTVLILDIDNFKNINDTFGHDVGDSVICHVAALASETMRSRDFLARIGGEEFAAILPDANIEQARAIAEHIREKIQNTPCIRPNNNIDVTVSIGIASIDDVRDSFDDLLHAADMAMYQAKSQGRNHVCNYSQLK